MTDAMGERGQMALNRSADETEATLRILASLPVPEGLEARMKAGLKDGAQRGKVLAWKLDEPESRGWLHSSVMRGLAAAAIVGAVVGGGWSVANYGRHSAVPNAITMPHMAAPGGFSSAGAMRTPQTLRQPAVPHTRAKEGSRTGETGKVKLAKKHTHKKAGEHTKSGLEKAVITNQ